jgi:hypothetical protein
MASPSKRALLFMQAFFAALSNASRRSCEKNDVRSFARLTRLWLNNRQAVREPQSCGGSSYAFRHSRYRLGDRMRSSKSYSTGPNTMTAAIAIILDRCQVDLIG